MAEGQETAGLVCPRVVVRTGYRDLWSCGVVGCDAKARFRDSCCGSGEGACAPYLCADHAMDWQAGIAVRLYLPHRDVPDAFSRPRPVNPCC